MYTLIRIIKYLVITLLEANEIKKFEKLSHCDCKLSILLFIELKKCVKYKKEARHLLPNITQTALVIFCKICAIQFVAKKKKMMFFQGV